MQKVYIADFKYGRPLLVKADLVKETKKQVHISGHEDVIGHAYYLPGRLDRTGYNIFSSLIEALEFLWCRGHDYIQGLQDQIAETWIYQSKIAELLELARKESD